MSSHTEKPDNPAMTQTERIIWAAKGIVERALGKDASEAAVLTVFERLCVEYDERAPEEDTGGDDGATVH